MTDDQISGRRITVVVITLCVVGASVALMIGARQPSVDGKPLSEGKRLEALEDMGDIAARLDPSADTRFTVEPSPKTEGGREIVALIKRDAAVEAALARGMRGLFLDDIVSPARLLTTSGRARSLNELDRYQSITELYYRDKLAVRDELARCFEMFSQQPPAIFLHENQLLRELSAKSEKLNRVTRNIFEFVENKNPSLTEDKKHLAFRHEELADFNQLTSQFTSALQDYVAEYKVFRKETDKAARNLADYRARFGGHFP